MLKVLRKKGVSKKVLWVLAIVIILSFGVFGTASYLQQSPSANYAGKIFGRKISIEDFKQSLLNARIQAIMRYGDNFYKISQFLDLEKEAWDRQILLHETKKRRIKISDKEVVEAIENMGFFKDNDVFSPDLYNRIVQYVFRCRPRDFEEGVRETLTFARLFEEETGLVDISEEEIREDYIKENEEVEVDYVLVPTMNFLSATVVEEPTIKDYFEQHKEEFRVPPTIKAAYLEFSFPPEITEEHKESLKNQVEQVYAQIQKNPDLAAVAGQLSLPLKESSYFSREQPDMGLGWPLEVFQTAFQ